MDNRLIGVGGGISKQAAANGAAGSAVLRLSRGSRLIVQEGEMVVFF